MDIYLELFSPQRAKWEIRSLYHSLTLFFSLPIKLPVNWSRYVWYNTIKYNVIYNNIIYVPFIQFFLIISFYVIFQVFIFIAGDVQSYKFPFVYKIDFIYIYIYISPYFLYTHFMWHLMVWKSFSLLSFFYYYYSFIY